jgi:hypothetical protein
VFALLAQMPVVSGGGISIEKEQSNETIFGSRRLRGSGRPWRRQRLHGRHGIALTASFRNIARCETGSVPHASGTCIAQSACYSQLPRRGNSAPDGFALCQAVASDPEPHGCTHRAHKPLNDLARRPAAASRSQWRNGKVRRWDVFHVQNPHRNLRRSQGRRSVVLKSKPID